MKEVMYPAGGAAVGVIVPIGVEFVAKGGRIFGDPADPNKGVKIGGVLGVVLGIPEITIAYLKRNKWSHETVSLMAAMGGAKLMTGASILILDELRKRAAYAFKNRRGTSLPIGRPETEGLERTEFPVVPLVEEI